MPKDLRGKGEYVTSDGKPLKQIAFSLKTSERKRAERKCREEWVKVDRDFERERYMVANPGLSSKELAAKVEDFERGNLKEISLNSLDPRTEAFRYFLDLERESNENILDSDGDYSEAELGEIIVDWQQGIDGYAEKRWLQNPSDQKAKRYENDGLEEFEEYLKRRGVRVRPDAKGLKTFADFFRRAKLESLRRDLYRLKGEPIEEHDSDFWKFAPALNTASGIVDGAWFSLASIILSEAGPPEVHPRKQANPGRMAW